MISTPASPKILASTRLLSLDVFRGLTIMFMIIVNNPGNGNFVYWPLEHARWNGLTPTDLVFPCFLFISGVSIAFALSTKKESGKEFPALIRTIIRRGLTLIFLGIFIHSFPAFDDLKNWSWSAFFSNMRFPGVLQRIGLVYIAASILFLVCSKKTIWVLAFAFIAAYYFLMAFVPVPGVGPANFLPALNLEAWVDRMVLGSAHLYRTTYFWDPEGVLSTLPSFSTALFGILTGYMLRFKQEAMVKCTRMLQYGLGLLALGLLFNFIFPINKNLWSSSFVLVTAGIANLLLSIAYYFVDIRKKTGWTLPFIVYGMNSILVYAIAEGLETVLSYIPFTDQGRPSTFFRWSYVHLISPLFSSEFNASMVWSICYSLCFMPLLWYFYKKKIFLKI